MTLQSCKILFFAKKVMLIDQIFEKNKIAKNMPKTSLQTQSSCFMQETALRNG